MIIKFLSLFIALFGVVAGLANYSKGLVQGALLFSFVGVIFMFGGVFGFIIFMTEIAETTGSVEK